MLTRRSRLTASFAITGFLAIVMAIVVHGLGLAGENAVAEWLQGLLEGLPVVSVIVEHAKASPPYAFGVFIGVSILAALVTDAVMSRSHVDIGLTEVVVKPMYQGSTGPLLYTGLTLFFVNLSRHVTAASVATDVTATTTFWGYGIAGGRLDVHSVWTVTATTTAVGATAIPVRTWTFKPNDEPGKIEVCRLIQGQTDATLFCQETIKFEPQVASWPYGKTKNYSLPVGEYLVRVRLRGVGTKGNHWARIINTGTVLEGQPLEWWTCVYRWVFRLGRFRRLASRTATPWP